jgi:hypothetical protein
MESVGRGEKFDGVDKFDRFDKFERFDKFHRFHKFHRFQRFTDKEVLVGSDTFHRICNST